MEPLKVGVLGLGFTGQRIPRHLDAPQLSWGTRRGRTGGIHLPDHFRTLHWDWTDQSTWRMLPTEGAVLILTAPPASKNLQEESQRLHHWGNWMQQNRPSLSRLVYVSTTSVYPQEAKTWSEQDHEPAGSESGQLRQATEQIMGEYFRLQVIRPGGIYGPGRNALERILSGKPLMSSRRLVHRIHAEDLARLCVFVAQRPQLTCINAVDLLPARSLDVLQWLETQPGFVGTEIPGWEEQLQAQVEDSVSAEDQVRRISNQRLLQSGFSFQYPTFKEGLTEVLASMNDGASS